MKVVIQRVKKAKVTVNNKITGEISKGICLFLGIKKGDGIKEINWLVEKVTGLRIFEDENGKMNLSLKEVNGKLLIVSQFTLYGDCTKGKRPSFFEAEDPQKAEKLYNIFIEETKKRGIEVETGIFGAMMDVELVNDGPVTFILEKEGRDEKRK